MSSSEVASHYNKVLQVGIEGRKESRIFFMRNMNNWVKSQLINDAKQRVNDNGVNNPRVLDLACGKGGDLKKWDIAGAKDVVMADVADVSIQQAEERYKQMFGYKKNNIFTVQFIVADCTKENLEDRIENKDPFDLVSCQFALHYSFVDEASARIFLKNAVGMLKPGGVFIGTLPDADRIVWSMRNGENGQFANEVCKITYENVEELAEGKVPLFGAKFHFSLDEQVNCPEFLAYFPLVKHLLEELDMELLFVHNFAEAINKWLEPGRRLLESMTGLETYPNEKLSGKSDDEYLEAKAKLDAFPEDERIKTMGTLSKSEWEAICMYLVFGFRKKKSEAEKTEEEPATTKPVAESESEQKEVTESEEKEDQEDCEHQEAQTN
ncbi:mRNA cap guanine-N(7) methyltransferase [Caenorhabditis elegans]|uniref:mRNA cap guanine-N(7) methyltransferase n=1 Tax=Caenorhabditis elegans TaxID=6239 RepID=MCES_CAEEL|nr:mRNA cap guanine-N7 methyltransferase [Caenorhabditis elegans]Q9XVS1.2 RecName: Full=mRNA cap guanine-N7 methyltransferase; AltName: Full=mRNA (guanine-N(7))-methyltransferase [Caenorhabditis elegans]CAB02758.2 mRNA cap guanine-N7 methyltransferase [Caenorhabditis elegans]|eukprot:NP_492674.2 mRNA cap guanine-N7 methyltransferase [Caenorhabditis elegans]